MAASLASPMEWPWTIQMAEHLVPSKADSLENPKAAPTASKMEPQMILILDCLKADSKDEPKAARSKHCLVAPMDASKDENLESYLVDPKGSLVDAVVGAALGTAVREAVGTPEGACDAAALGAALGTTVG
jgi:hypothetical protein